MVIPRNTSRDMSRSCLVPSAIYYEQSTGASPSSLLSWVILDSVVSTESDSTYRSPEGGLAPALRLPAVPLAGPGDMSRVMFRMPGVQRGCSLQRPRPGFRMNELLLKLFFREASENF